MRARSIIAGYHWFTDWGRDTMISLEGLTLLYRPAREAGYICGRSDYVRDGLIPNFFPKARGKASTTRPTRHSGSFMRSIAHVAGHR